MPEEILSSVQTEDLSAEWAEWAVEIIRYLHVDHCT